MAEQPIRARPARFLRRWRLWLLVICALLAFAAVISPLLIRAYEAGDFAADIAAGARPSALKRETPPPLRTTIAYTVDGKDYVGDIYVPGGDRKPVAAAVAVPGVVAEGKDDSRLVAFATSLARGGFLVLAPDIPNVRSLKISSSDADVISDAARYLASASGNADKRSIGLFAFSYAAGPALIAAMKPDTRHLVRFVCTVGAYYSVEAAVTYFTTGYFRSEGGSWTLGHPSAYAKWVFLLSNAARLDKAQDREALKTLADRRLADEEADVHDLVEELGPEGRAVYALMSNQDPRRVPQFIAQLPPAIRQEMRSLDLRNQDFKSLEAHLILVHGRDDTLVPYTESADLSHAFQGRRDLFLIASLGHVEPRLSNISDLFKFWRAAYEILSERDDMPAPQSVLLRLPERMN